MNLLSLAVISFLSFGVLVNAQFTCSPTQPCEIGCCTKFGSCGLGPDSCGPANCISNCDRKSDCDPGWGPKWSAKQSCPLNVCCSKFGFCGTTSEFCGNKKVTAPTCSGSSSSTRTIGYYESWAVGRPCDKMYPEGIPTGSYTHLNFAFAFIHPATFVVAPMSPSDPALYTRFTGLKNTNPGLQTWISIGGWSMNDPDQPTATTFSTLAGSSSAQTKFFASVLSFLETYGFDGVDLDWEYPVAPERSGNPADFKNLVSFLRNFRNALHSSGHNYGLTITIPSSFWYLQNFDIVEIEKTIDWFNVMSYDLHGTWDSTNKFLGPYIAAHTNLTEIDNALSLLWRNNIKPGNVVLGLGFYGRSFTLADPKCRTAGCKFTSGARAGKCTQSVGTLSFAEIERIVASGATVIKDDTAAVKMVVYDTDQWVSYDDAETLKMKINYANAHCLGGTMVWAVSTDDALGSAAAALSLSTKRKPISLAATTGPDPLMMCQLGDCGKSCPAGLSAVQNTYGKDKGSPGIDTGCSGGKSRLYCCPSNDMPTCAWRGTAPFCGGKCEGTEVEVTSSTAGDGKSCWTGHKVLCCKKTGSDSAAGQCQWKGSAPFCSSPFGQADCPFGQKALTASHVGAGGEQPCGWGLKSFCCGQPPPYTGCDWYYHGGSFWLQVPLFCTGVCPAGKGLIATDPVGCLFGQGAFCCDNPSRSNDPLVEDFKRRLATFANDPTCNFKQKLHSRRGAQEVEIVPSNLSLSQPNDPGIRASLDKFDFTILIQQLSQIIRGRGQTNQQTAMANQYNMIYGDRYGLHTSDIANFYDDWPNTDQLTLTKNLMCMGQAAIQYLSQYHRSRSQVCVNPCSAPRARIESPLQPSTAAASNESLLFARNLHDSEFPLARGPGQQPSWALMMATIMGDQMPLEYAQLILTNSNEQILEIVWRLPVRNPNDPNGSFDPVYQDHDPQDSVINPDRYVVFHFHFDHLAQIGGALRPALYAIVAFHAQFYPTGPWTRIDGNGHHDRNVRTPILNCNRRNPNAPGTDFFYPGQFTDQEAEDQTRFFARGRMLVLFTNHLVRQRLLTADTFTGPRQGQLTLDRPDRCGIRRFLWNGYTLSRQFGANGGDAPGRGPNAPRSGGGNQQDDDGV